MAGFFSQIKEKFNKTKEEHDIPDDQDYVELDESKPADENLGDKKIVRPFNLDVFEDIKDVLDVLREGNTIALVNIRPLKEKDLVELKRAINKLKKTTDAIGGDIAGFGDDWIVVTPSFAKIHRSGQFEDVSEE